MGGSQGRWGFEMEDDVKNLAENRHKLHEGQASHRPLSEGYEYVGLRGEEAFSALTGLPLDRSELVGGDRGWDFIVPSNGESEAFTIDVKTARKAGHLIVEEGKVLADVYVLARYEDYGDRVDFLGWANGWVVSRRPVRDFGYGVLNHYLPVRRLESMILLYERISPPETVICECGRPYERGRPDWTTCLRCELKSWGYNTDLVVGSPTDDREGGGHDANPGTPAQLFEDA